MGEQWRNRLKIIRSKRMCCVEIEWLHSRSDSMSRGIWMCYRTSTTIVRWLSLPELKLGHWTETATVLRERAFSRQLSCFAVCWGTVCPSSTQSSPHPCGSSTVSEGRRWDAVLVVREEIPKLLLSVIFKLHQSQAQMFCQVFKKIILAFCPFDFHLMKLSQQSFQVRNL